MIISIDHITWHTVPAMETTEAVKLWLSPESVFERASETGTQNKQSKEKKYGTDFHTRYKGENTANHLPPFCKK